MLINKEEHMAKDLLFVSRRTAKQPSIWGVIPIFSLILLTLFIISRINYLMFHTLAELFAILVAWSLFGILWNTKDLIENKALVFIGIAFLFVGGIDLAHTLAYSGMGIFELERGANPATQLWILARYMQSISLLLFPFFFFRQINPYRVVAVFSFITLAGLLSILYWEIFPACYIDGIGLTAFKKASEYIICAILVIALMILRQKKADLDSQVYRYIVLSIILTICAEIAFTFYVSVYGLSNLIGHFFKIVSFYCIYRALIRSGLTQPQSILFNQLEQSEAQFRAMFEEHSAVMLLIDPLTGRIINANKAAEQYYGYSLKQLLEMKIHQLNRLSPEQVAQQMQQAVTRKTTRFEFQHVLADGKTRDVEAHSAPIMIKDQMLLLSIISDITENKKLQAQLTQAQKMESVGRLAGGVAHDFNNMLGVILGNTELAMLRTDEDHDLYSDLKEIQTAAKRSADITKQLLAFARKEIISPRQLDLNDTVGNMLNMLRRLIGEDIDLVWLPARQLWPVKMDPSQIDQILANLCVNARDAIDGIGKITIETGRKTFDEEYCRQHSGFIPGDYVLLAASDNGCGMDKHTLDNLFEPFFTTKELGKGTGLGLATVYGIVKQNNGFINVYSEPGQGSTFNIYLSRLVDDNYVATAVPERETAAGGTETILLVEDEPAILRMTRMMLERKGYAVIPAATPAEAVEKGKIHSGAIDLLMTDVVMPGMNGRDLAGKIIALYPGIRLLFMSGYTANVIAHHGVLDDGVAFIQKPFSMTDMTAKVRELLDMVSDKKQG